MSKRRWKRHEQQIAERFGATRNPCNGKHHTDVDAGPFAIEVKTRMRLPSWLTDAVAQIVRAAGDRTPLVILVESRQGVKTKRFVLMRMEDWEEWHGKSLHSPKG